MSRPGEREPEAAGSVELTTAVLSTADLSTPVPSTAVLSIGANLGEAAEALCSVLDAARAEGALVAHSGLYVTPPWGGVEQDDFRNAVVVVRGPRSPWGWLEWARAREDARDRRREQRWGPRTLDVDVVQVRNGDCFDEVRSADPELTLPHPRAAERAFVLVPWLEVEPGARLGGQPLSVHLDRLDPEERAGVRPATAAERGRWPEPPDAGAATGERS